MCLANLCVSHYYHMLERLRGLKRLGSDGEITSKTGYSICWGLLLSIASHMLHTIRAYREKETETERERGRERERERERGGEREGGERHKAL